MIKLYVWDKKFGQSLIKYKQMNADGEIVKEGKCREYEKISEIYFGLIAEHGFDNVKIISH